MPWSTTWVTQRPSRIVAYFRSRAVLSSARAGNHRFQPLSALRAHTKTPYKNDLLCETLRALNKEGGLGQYAMCGMSVASTAMAECRPLVPLPLWRSTSTRSQLSPRQWMPAYGARMI